MMPGMIPVIVRTNELIIKGRATPYANSGASSHNMTLPSGIVAGELIVIAAATNGPTTLSTPTGFSVLGDVRNGSGSSDRRLYVFYKFADGSEGSTVSTSLSASNSLVSLAWRISGALALEWATASGSSSGPNPPSLSPSWGLAKTLWLTPLAARAPITAYPAGFADTQTASASVMYAAAAELVEETATKNPGAFSLSGSESWAVATLAIRPAI